MSLSQSYFKDSVLTSQYDLGHDIKRHVPFFVAKCIKCPIFCSDPDILNSVTFYQYFKIIVNQACLGKTGQLKPNEVLTLCSH